MEACEAMDGPGSSKRTAKTVATSPTDREVAAIVQSSVIVWCQSVFSPNVTMYAQSIKSHLPSKE
jgi:hypothetical protein